MSDVTHDDMKNRKLVHAAKLMGITVCRLRGGGGFRESIDRDVLEFYEDAGVTFPVGFVALLESHVKWLNEEDPILIRRGEVT